MIWFTATAVLLAAAAPLVLNGCGGADIERKIVIIGIDGMDWSLADPLMEEGKLPNLASLIQDGAYGYLSNGRESISARIWSTMFSGSSRCTKRNICVPATCHS